MNCFVKFRPIFFFLILKCESKFEVFDLASLINLYVCDYTLEYLE